MVFQPNLKYFHVGISFQWQPTQSRFRDDGNGNDRESLGNRSRRPRQYSSILAVIIRTTATVTTNPSNAKEPLGKMSSFKDLRQLYFVRQ